MSGWDMLLVKRDSHLNPCALNCLCILTLLGNQIRKSEADWQLPEPNFLHIPAVDTQNLTAELSFSPLLHLPPQVLYSFSYRHLTIHESQTLHSPRLKCGCEFPQGELQTQRRSLTVWVSALTCQDSVYSRSAPLNLLFNEYKPAQLSLRLSGMGLTSDPRSAEASCL